MKVKLHRDLFDRWIIVPAEYPGVLGWNGSRWVPSGGPVQVCNFDTREQARDYAREYGFTLPEFDNAEHQPEAISDE